MSWNLYGPFVSWPDAEFVSPIQTLVEPAREAAIASENLPPEGGSGLYVLRHRDELGREETSVTCVALQVIGGAAVPAVWAPAWPAAGEWKAAQCGDSWEIEARWGARFDELRVVAVDLLEQARGGDEQIVQTQAVRGSGVGVSFRRVPSGSSCRYRLRARGEGGASAESPWSAWMSRAPDESRLLQTI